LETQLTLQAFLDDFQQLLCVTFSPGCAVDKDILNFPGFGVATVAYRGVGIGNGQNARSMINKNTARNRLKLWLHGMAHTKLLSSKDVAPIAIRTVRKASNHSEPSPLLRYRWVVINQCEQKNNAAITMCPNVRRTESPGNHRNRFL
jgi:hypothetical protein